MLIEMPNGELAIRLGFKIEDILKFKKDAEKNNLKLKIILIPDMELRIYGTEVKFGKVERATAFASKDTD